MHGTPLTLGAVALLYLAARAGEGGSRAPAVAQHPDTLWVGTTARNLLGILAHGLVPRAGWSPHRTDTRDAVFLTDEPEAALMYADVGAANTPVLLEVDVSGLLLVPDYDDIEVQLDALLWQLNSGDSGTEDHGIQPGKILSQQVAEHAEGALEWILSQSDQDAIQAEIVWREEGPYLAVRPLVGLQVDTRLMRQFPELYEDLAWRQGHIFFMSNQYQHRGTIPTSRIRQVLVPVTPKQATVTLTGHGYLVDQQGLVLQQPVDPQRVEDYDFKRVPMRGLSLQQARAWAQHHGSANRRRPRGAHAELVQAVQGGLTPDLIRHDKCEPTGKSPQECHCYHAAEAVYHLAGAKRSGLVPVSGKLRKVTHWWLEDRKSGEIVDPTADQLPKRYDYTQGTRRGFLTLQPSKRAQVVIDRAKEIL